MESLYLLIPLSVVLVLSSASHSGGRSEWPVRRHGRSGLPDSHG